MMQNRYDLHHIASENGEQLHKNKVWGKGVKVVKVESIQIIRYGPYIRIGNYADKMVWESGVVKIGIEGAIAKVGVTRGDSNYNCVVTCSIVRVR